MGDNDDEKEKTEREGEKRNDLINVYTEQTDITAKMSSGLGSMSVVLSFQLK